MGYPYGRNGYVWCTSWRYNAALAVFCKIRKLSFGRMEITIIPGVVISQMIGVWGNFFSREYTGRYTDSILAMQLPAETLSGARLTAEMQENIVKIGEISYVQVHPLFFMRVCGAFFCCDVLHLFIRNGRISGRDLYEISCRIRVGKSRNWISVYGQNLYSGNGDFRFCAGFSRDFCWYSASLRL